MAASSPDRRPHRSVQQGEQAAGHPQGGDPAGKADAVGRDRSDTGLPPGGVDHHRFVAEIRRACGIDRRQARRLCRASLETLAETLLPAEARRLADRLPAALAPYVGAGPALQRMETLSQEEFVRRVMVRAGAGEHQRDQLAEAIEAVVAVTVAHTGMVPPPGPFSHLRRLPPGHQRTGAGRGPLQAPTAPSSADEPARPEPAEAGREDDAPPQQRHRG